MDEQELVTQAEFARRVGVTKSRINALVKEGRFYSCIKDGKLIFEEAKLIFGERKQQKMIQDTPIKKKPTKSNTKRDTETSAEYLLKEILEAISGDESTRDRATLDGLKLKASILKEFFLAQSEKMKHKKLAENLFSRDEVLEMFKIAINILRNALLEMPNNYASILPEQPPAKIREIVMKDVNTILQDFNDVGKNLKQ